MRMSPHSKEEAENGVGITFSKVKYRFQNMLSEVRELKSKEHASRVEAESLIQKLRTMESEQDKAKASLQAQINESVEARQKLENAVKMMGLEASAMDNKVKSSKLQLKAVLQSRNTALEELKISKYELEQKLKNATSQLTVATEKLSRNSMLIEAVEVEASSVKRALDDTQQIVRSRESTVKKLQQQVAWMVDAERKLLDKARTLESELKNKHQALCEKDTEILALKQLLETKENDGTSQLKYTLVQNASVAKDRTISQLNNDKQSLLSEVEGLTVVVRRLQGTVQEQESALQMMRENLLSSQLLAKEKSAESEERLHLLDLKEKLVGAHASDIQRLEAEKEGRLEKAENSQCKECQDQSTSTDDLLELVFDSQEFYSKEQHCGSQRSTEAPHDHDDEEIVLQAEPSALEDPSTETYQTVGRTPEHADNREQIEDKKNAADAVISLEKLDSTLDNTVTISRPQLEEVSLDTCICGRPPHDEMLKCVSCDAVFHAACGSWQQEEASAFLCTGCKDQPAKKRMRADAFSEHK